MTFQEWLRLCAAVDRAQMAACAAAAACPSDGAGCNLDCVFVPTGKGRRIARRDKHTDSLFGTRSQTGYRTSIGQGFGQGARNTAAVEAAAKELQDWGAYVLYIAD